MSQHQFKYISTLDRLNEILTYIEFFKSSMTNWELLTAIQDQMDKHSIHKQFLNIFYDKYINRSYLTPGPVTPASLKLYEIINELESKCKHDLTNKQQ